MRPCCRRPGKERSRSPEWSDTGERGECMGSIFPYVADEALRHYDPAYYTHCQVCRNSGTRVFTAHGTATLAGGIRKKVYAACAGCIQDARVQQVDEWATDPLIEAYVQGYLKGAEPAAVRQLQSELKDKLRRTPHDPPQVQRTDWPMCCGDLTEYTGSPQKRTEWQALTQTAFGWRRGEILKPDPGDEDEPDDEWPEWNRWLEAFIPVDSGDELPSLGAFAVFRCLRCGKRYWTFQCT